jgi:CBS domain-containing protein
MERLAVVARFKPEAAEQVRGLLASGPPFDLREAGLDRHTVYLTAQDAVFVFEGPNVEWEVDDLAGDFLQPELQAALSSWRTLLGEDPRVGRVVFHWDRTGEGPPGTGAGLALAPTGETGVADLMRRDFVEVAPEDTLGETVEKLVAAPGGPALVLDFGRLIGVVASRDVLRAVADRVHPSEGRVREWMSEVVCSVTPATSAEEAALAMVEHGLHHLPVVENERAVGLVSLRDVVGRARGSLRDAPKPVGGQA